MSQTIIIPERPRLLPDPYIAPIFGKRGPCALCRNYSDLTENHVPPEAVGNSDHWVAQSYMTAAAANTDIYFGRHFRGGIRFRTLCAQCNNGLGGKEDKVIADFYGKVRGLLESRIILPPIAQITTKPNLLYRGLMAHIVSANDSGGPNSFDQEARNLFFGKQSLRLSSWNLFYWIYLAPTAFLMRDAFLTTWNPLVEMFPIQILKFFPLAFMFARKHSFLRTPNLASFLQERDDDEIDVPIELYRIDRNPVWPVAPENNTAVFFHGNSYGLVAHKD